MFSGFWQILKIRTKWYSLLQKAYWMSCAKFIQSVWFSKTVLYLMLFQELKIKQDRNLSLLLMNGMFWFEMKRRIRLYRKIILISWGDCLKVLSQLNILLSHIWQVSFQSKKWKPSQHLIILMSLLCLVQAIWRLMSVSQKVKWRYLQKNIIRITKRSKGGMMVIS